jgi:hypothetical protein
MAVILQMTYMKNLGLPNFSSHSCAVSLTVEIPDASVAAQESSKLYSLLQTAVDGEIQQVGFMPDATTYGMNNQPAASGAGAQPSNAGNGNGRAQRPLGNGGSGGPSGANGAWRCSEKQRQFIEKIVWENHLDKHNVETLAVELFGAGVRQLDRRQASGFIDELLDRHGGGRRTDKRPYRRGPAHSQSRGVDGQ